MKKIVLFFMLICLVVLFSNKSTLNIEACRCNTPECKVN